MYEYVYVFALYFLTPSRISYSHIKYNTIPLNLSILYWIFCFCCIYRPFHKTLPRSNASVNWMSVRFFETDCTNNMRMKFWVFLYETHGNWMNSSNLRMSTKYFWFQCYVYFRRRKRGVEMEVDYNNLDSNYSFPFMKKIGWN